MKFKRILICGASLLIACAMGSAVHASADSNTQSNDQANEVATLEQPSNGQNNNDQNAAENNQNNQNNQTQQQPNQKQSNQNNAQANNNRPAPTPVQKTNKVRRNQRTNYYTRVAAPRRHRQGYAIYANPYHTQGVKPIGHQRRLANRAIHVIREAIVNNQHWINFQAKVSGWMNYNGTVKNTRWLNVPLIAQRPQLPSGCEITATTMMLRYRDGRKINKMWMARLMPRSSNPNYGFVGSPYSYSGWWIKPRALMGVVNRFTHHKAINMTGASTRRILSQINKGIPVVVWVGAMDGFPNHALTIYGYEGHHYMYNDPWLDRREVRTFGYLNYKRAVDALIPYGALSYRK